MAAAGVDVLADLAIVLGVAAVTTVVFQKLRQPVALGYLLAGLIIGPHVPVPLVADPGLVSTLSELGVILVMFSIGLELDLRKIARLGVPAAFTAVLEVGLMLAVGYVAGRLLGWSGRESLFAGACLSISSTMLVAKAFAEQKLTDSFTELVFAILVFEDVAAILMLTILTALASGAGMSPGQFVVMAGKLAGFLAGMLVVGMLVVPRAMRAIAKLGRAETLLIASLAICFAMALAAEHAGYSVALGAFLAGMLVAESGARHAVEPLIEPFRDAFGAIFFVSVGMSIDPRLVAEQWLPILVLSALVIAGKLVGVSAGAFLAGNGLRRSVRASMSLAQIGEFSFIIAALGESSGATRSFLLPVAVGVSCLTALATPWLVRGSDRAARWVDARLPRRVQTFVAFYGSWIDGIRAAPRRARSPLRRPIIFLIVDAALVVGTLVAAATLRVRILQVAREQLGLDETLALIGLAVAATALAALFFLGVLRRAQRLAKLLAEEVMPGPTAEATAGVDLRIAPRKALVFTLELAIVLVVGLPMVVVTQPFVPIGPLIFGVVVLAIAFVVWRSISNLEGHVRAGSEILLEALQRQGRAPTAPPSIDEARQFLPGIPGLATIEVPAGCAAVGKSLGELNVRARTGATILAVHRVGSAETDVALPTAGTVLAAGDVLAVAGADDAVTAARALFQ